MTPARSGLALGLFLGAVVDAVVGDPRPGHPVAFLGRAVTAAESRVWADSRWRGAVFALGWLAAGLAAGTVAEHVARRRPRPWCRVTLTAAATWSVLGGTTLAREGQAMARLLGAGDVPGARARLPHLCGRSPDRLDADEIARATVESLAENTSDAVVAPLFWGAVAGLPGMLAYRVVNTLDAMIGHRSPRHERFGWLAARLDDAANLAPARITGVLAAVLAPLAGGRPADALRVMRRDGAVHPSPNAGRCEAAFAGALGVRLGGTTVYGDRVETRGPLGDGPSPGVPDIDRAVRLSRAVGIAAVALAVLATRWRDSVQENES